MNQLYILLLALWPAINSTDAWVSDEHATAAPWQRSMSESRLPDFYGMFYTDEEFSYENDLESEDSYDGWDPDEHTTADPWQRSMSESHHPDLDFYSKVFTDEETSGYEYELESEDVPEPNITVYRQMEDREHVMVLCKFAEIFTYRGQSFELSVESELNYTIEQQQFSSFYSSEMRVYMVTVSPNASFTCVHEIGFNLNVSNLRSQTYNYNYSGSVSDHCEEGASSLYICFSSFIAVGLFIMTTAVIVINIRSKTKDTNSTAVTNNDYVEA